MATISLQALKVVGSISGNSPEIGCYPEAASQSFKAGALVYLSSGKVTECTSGSGNPTSILGVAVHDASGTTDQDCLVYIANEDTIFEGNCYNDGDADSDDAPAITNVGSKFGVVKVSNDWHVDLSDTTDLCVQIRRISPKDAAGDIYGRVHFLVLRDIAQLGPGEKTA